MSIEQCKINDTEGQLSDAERWEVHAVYHRQHACLFESVQNEVNNQLCQIPIAIQGLGIKNPQLVGAINGVSAQVFNSIVGTFTIITRTITPQELADATTGAYKRKSPSESFIFWSRLSSIAAILLEILVFSGMIVYDDADFAILIIAIMLAGGAWGLGFGVAQMISPKETDERRDKVLPSVFIVVGLILVAGITALRWVKGSPTAGGITLLLSLFITTAEFIYAWKKNVRVYYIGKMFKVQRYTAEKCHAFNCGIAPAIGQVPVQLPAPFLWRDYIGTLVNGYLAVGHAALIAGMDNDGGGAGQGGAAN